MGRRGGGTQELRESVGRLFSPDCESSERKEVILLHLHFRNCLTQFLAPVTLSIIKINKLC